MQVMVPSLIFATATPQHLNTSTPMKRPHTLIAEHFGMDSRDVYETRHHYGRTARPIYVLDGDYFCVSRTRPTDEFGNGWEPLAKLPATTIWISRV